VLAVRLVLENTGSATWRSSSPAGDHFGLAVHWDERVVANHMLPRADVAPGERVTLRFALEVPIAPGVHRLALKMVQYQVTVFEDRGAAPLALDVVVDDVEPDRGATLWEKMQRYDPWQYMPTRGITRGTDGEAYPVFADRAEGCHLWDLSGKRYIDYTMGWGTMLLGYAHPRVTAALTEIVKTGSLVAWPQPIEIEVAEMLCRDFPSSDPGSTMICFGKNGSDACTFAARMARVFTNKKTILFSGYHGWQDFWVEQAGFARTGVVPHSPPIIHRFPFNDLAAFHRLYAEHKHDLAAVMVEPSPWKGDGLGFEPDSDPIFLLTIADAAHRAGALLIFDEIVTGYRYPGNSVQRAKGVAPDLTCLGKAIANGMPLSAVVGRGDVFKSALPRTFFAATFHGEAYSFAAAKAAIEVYRTEPVVEHIWDYGARLRDGIDTSCRELGVDARMHGPPWRMNFLFATADRELLQLQRALFQQELLKSGITTYNGVMMPSYAHDENALRETLDAFGRSLDVVARTTQHGDWDERLEIPPLVDL
jgi:glutamate-1-semialdehyde aminotransferase